MTGNALSLVTGIIAAGLYGNIGISCVICSASDWGTDIEILQRLSISTLWKSGLTALISCPERVDISFIIGSAIPQILTITGLIAAVAIMQFTYTFPLFLRFGYDVITDAMVADEAYTPGKGTRGRVDNWSQWSRWKRVCYERNSSLVLLT
ncbi:hypothetical protein C0991_004624 [Blastosporella zonata]|nr:hypothetical protein C0991_004624 [Blastosporella zonata]